MAGISELKDRYSWIESPLIVGAPMRLIALADLAVEVSKAGGIGFIGAGTDVSELDTHIQRAYQLFSTPDLTISGATLPIGIGFINWGPKAQDALAIVQKYRPAAVWFFAPSNPDSLREWADGTRSVSPQTQIWIQIGSVREAVEACRVARPDVLVVQGTDAGGHGRAQGASLISLLPEVNDALQDVTQKQDIVKPVLIAAGGIMEGRSAAAAMVLGASGVVLGTRLLAANEAVISKGYRQAILTARDGGQSTVRTKVYDNARGTTGWAETHNARGVINKTYTDSLAGMTDENNKKLYDLAVKQGDEGWGEEGRMTTYAGTGVGLIKEILPAKDIVLEVREGAKEVLMRLRKGNAMTDM